MRVAAKTVLCADDSPSSLGTWIELLDQFGHHAIATTDARAVVPILQCVPVHLVVVEYFMLKLDGGAVAAAIREHSSVPILLTSNSVADIPQGVREVVNAVVAKQDGLAVLARNVHALLLSSGK